jgi:acyl carrier protein phosphodiesterase
VSSAGKRKSEALPPEWKRLERTAEEAGILLGRWIARATEAEEEVQRLRTALEGLAARRPGADDLDDELKRLKAENAALHSRMIQARKRVATLMQRLAALEMES